MTSFFNTLGIACYPILSTFLPQYTKLWEDRLTSPAGKRYTVWTYKQGKRVTPALYRTFRLVCIQVWVSEQKDILDRKINCTNILQILGNHSLRISSVSVRTELFALTLIFLEPETERLFACARNTLHLYWNACYSNPKNLNPAINREKKKKQIKIIQKRCIPFPVWRQHEWGSLFAHYPRLGPEWIRSRGCDPWGRCIPPPVCSNVPNHLKCKK